MTLQFLNDYINEKMSKNENYIVFTYYELRVKSTIQLIGQN